MSKSLLLIVSTEIMKIKIFYLENMGAGDSKAIGTGVMQGGLHEMIIMTVRSSLEAWFDIYWDTCSINFVNTNMIKFGK